MSDLPGIKVGITGHRLLGNDPRTPWHIHARCVQILDRLQDLSRFHGTNVVAYSALAIGADQIFAWAALSLGMPLIGVLPFEDYLADFEQADRERFNTLLSFCAQVHRMPYRRRSNKAYFSAGKWIVNQSDILLAVWNGLPGAGPGGTADVVDFARKRKKPTIIVKPETFEAI